MKMRRLIVNTIIKGASGLQLLLVLGLVQVHLQNVSGLPQGSSTDPCESGPCGKGAECKPMGSIAICVCPNNGKGDPFIACMQKTEEAELAKPSPSASASSPPSSVNHSHVHHSRASFINTGTTSKPTTLNTTTSRPRVSLITGSTTVAPVTSTSTRSPYVHVYEPTSDRPPTTSSTGHFYSYDYPSSNRPHGDGSAPDSHRIPIIGNSNNGNTFPQHDYPPRPIVGGDSLSTSPPSYSTYPYGSNNGAIANGGSYDIFTEQTIRPVSGSEYGSTNPSYYPYRGTSSSGYFSGGSQNVYEYDSQPIRGPVRPTPTMEYRGHADRYAHHSYHPSSSGFPDPITEASGSKYGTAYGSTPYDIYNYNPVRNDIDGAYSRIADPLGKYENCRMVNGVVVCADNAKPFPYNHPQYPPHHQEGSHYHHRGDIMTTTASYGFHSSQHRDHYSSYYPSRYASATPPMMTSDRPLFDYHYDNRRRYPEHGPRYPIDSEASSSSTTYTYHPFLPKEQKVSTQNVIAISPSSSSSGIRSENDNDNPLCKSMCGVNSVCRLVMDRPVCGCPEDHTGDPSVRCSPMQFSGRGQRRDADSNGNGCASHINCKETEICANNQCIDPCKHQDQIIEGISSSLKIDSQFKTSICGTNSECLVVGHTPVCKCNEGFVGNPYVACVP